MSDLLNQSTPKLINNYIKKIKASLLIVLEDSVIRLNFET